MPYVLRIPVWLLAAMALLCLFSCGAQAKEIHPGPYRAEVVKVIDSDTVRTLVQIWPGQTVTVSVRVYGVDTPEKFRPRCPAEKTMAMKATAFVRGLIKPGDVIRLRAVQRGKYAGRVVAQVYIINANGDEVSLGQLLIDRGFARPYFGGHKSSWCKEDKQDARD